MEYDGIVVSYCTTAARAKKNEAVGSIDSCALFCSIVVAKESLSCRSFRSKESCCVARRLSHHSTNQIGPLVYSCEDLSSLTSATTTYSSLSIHLSLNSSRSRTHHTHHSLRLHLILILFYITDKRNVGPKETPLWTAEKLDEEGRRAGRATDWARKARAGDFVKDPSETLVIAGGLRYYNMATALLIAIAFGTPTRVLLEWIGSGSSDGSSFADNLQGPALALILANVGSSIFCYIQAEGKNRSKFVWFVKGLMGGPLAVAEFSQANVLMTQAETEEMKTTTTVVGE